MDRHHLKTLPEFFAQVVIGAKPFEIRKADRDFKVGDVLVLEEWCSNACAYTGAVCEKLVSYVLPGGQFGLEVGYCVMGLADPAPAVEAAQE